MDSWRKSWEGEQMGGQSTERWHQLRISHFPTPLYHLVLFSSGNIWVIRDGGSSGWGRQCGDSGSWEHPIFSYSAALAVDHSAVVVVFRLFGGGSSGWGWVAGRQQKPGLSHFHTSCHHHPPTPPMPLLPNGPNTASIEWPRTANNLNCEQPGAWCSSSGGGRVCIKIRCVWPPLPSPAPTPPTTIIPQWRKHCHCCQMA